MKALSAAIAGAYWLGYIETNRAIVKARRCPVSMEGGTRRRDGVGIRCG